jgi:hypothetical protein
MMNLAVFIIPFALSFIVLYIIRNYLTANRLSSGDTYFHLYISESIRKNSWKFPSSLNNVVLDEGGNNKYHYLIYPPLLHYITALFPAKYYLKIAKNLNLIFLSMLSAIAATAVYTITSDLFLTLIATVIVIFNLSMFELAVTFTPRPLGLLFYSLIMFVTVFYPPTVFTVLIITILIALVTLSHKFAVQMLVIGLVPYAILFGKPFFIISLILGLLLSILVSRGFYLKILREHLSWLHFYLFHPSKTKMFAKFRQIFLRNSWYLAVASSATVFLLIENGQYNDIMLSIFFWVFIPLIAAVIVSIPHLSFLGEEYRYIEYSIVPVAVAVAWSIMNINLYSLITLSISAALSFIALFKYKKYLFKSMSLTNPADITAYNSLKEYSPNDLMVIPHTRTLEVGYFTRIQVIHGVRTNSSSAIGQLNHLMTTYDIKYVLKFRDNDPYDMFAALKKIAIFEKIGDFKNFELFQIQRPLIVSTSNEQDSEFFS